MPKIAELTGLQIQEYLESHQLTRENIIDSINKLRKRNRRAGSAGERAENEGKILDLSGKKGRLDARRIAFEANRVSINPPSEEQLDALKNLVEEVEQLNANGRILEQVVALTNDSLNTFRAIHPGSDA